MKQDPFVCNNPTDTNKQLRANIVVIIIRIV